MIVNLTKREQEVLKLLSEGFSNRVIGKKLFIEESTVKFHMGSILKELRARNRTHAVSIAFRRKLLK